jgi:hypothetical protein
MGDRRLVLLRFPDKFSADLAVYTHWRGSEAADLVSDITNTDPFKERVGDITYAAKIFVDQFTKDARDQAIGYGVFPVMHGEDPTRFAENEYPGLIVVDLETGEVSY